MTMPRLLMHALFALLLSACSESPPPQAGPSGAAPDASAMQPSVFTVGQSVEIEASGHWVPCVVVENHPDAIMRVRCTAYPELSRGEGIYTVDRDNPHAVRAATGVIGKPAEPVAATSTSSATGDGLRVGEYACYGSGGRAMFGLAFRVSGDGEYTDLDGEESGRFVVSGSEVSFDGGHLDGMKGRSLNGQRFALGAQAECEPE